MFKNKISVLAAFIVIFFMVSLVLSSNADVQKPILVVEKNISQSKFLWTDTEVITIKIINEGNSIAKEIHLSDQIPSGFLVVKGNLTTTEDMVNVNLPILDVGDEQTITYSITGKQGMNGNLQIFLQPAEIVYADFVGNQYEKKSNHIEIMVESVSWEGNFVGTIFLLIVVTFAFGYFGSIIRLVTPDSTDKEKKKNDIKIATTVQALLGGAAGIIVLGSFQGLSTLFSGGLFNLNAQTIIVLLSTCFAAGFAPQAVIDKFIQQWKNKASDAIEKSDANKAKSDSADVENQALTSSNTAFEKTLIKYMEKNQSLETELKDIKVENQALKSYNTALEKEIIKGMGKDTSKKENKKTP
ncbi:MAG: hypothetical protein HY223_08610 [Thaumarchaeota archaeon]|nr:hypothetical protein [Nitrososphaerota archaeon]